MSIPTHKHHIIPKHMGGTDDLTNLIEVTVEEHAEIHKQLWEKHGKWQDFVAWQGLSGRIGREEIIRQVQLAANIGRKMTPEQIEKMAVTKRGKKQSQEHIKKRVAKIRGKKRPPRSKEWKKKLSESLRGKENTHWIGRKHTKESKEKNRQAHLGHTYNRGRKFPKIKCEKCGKNISENRLSVHQNGNKCNA